MPGGGCGQGKGERVQGATPFLKLPDLVPCAATKLSGAILALSLLFEQCPRDGGTRLARDCLLLSGIAEVRAFTSPGSSSRLFALLCVCVGAPSAKTNGPAYQEVAGEKGERLI